MICVTGAGRTEQEDSSPRLAVAREQVWQPQRQNHRLLQRGLRPVQPCMHDRAADHPQHAPATSVHLTLGFSMTMAPWSACRSCFFSGSSSSSSSPSPLVDPARMSQCAPAAQARLSCCALPRRPPSLASGMRERGRWTSGAHTFSLSMNVLIFSARSRYSVILDRITSCVFLFFSSARGQCGG